MKKIIIVLLSLFLLASVAAAEGSHVFTDKDLQKYKAGSTIDRPAEQPEAMPAKQTAGSVAERRDHRTDQEYWCEQGRAADDKVKSAKEHYDIVLQDVASARRYETGEIVILPRDYSRPVVKEAKEELDAAIKSRERLNDDARRMSIPPGWLRCQFE